MTATSFENGHPVYTEATDATETTWVTRYADTGEPIDDNPRPCPKCGKMQTEEGYDGCIGYVPGASDVCCGHGVEEPYIQFKGQWALDAIEWAKARGDQDDHND